MKVNIIPVSCGGFAFDRFYSTNPKGLVEHGGRLLSPEPPTQP